MVLFSGEMVSPPQIKYSAAYTSPHSSLHYTPFHTSTYHYTSPHIFPHLPLPVYTSPHLPYSSHQLIPVLDPTTQNSPTPYSFTLPQLPCIPPNSFQTPSYLVLYNMVVPLHNCVEQGWPTFHIPCATFLT